MNIKSTFKYSFFICKLLADLIRHTLRIGRLSYDERWGVALHVL